MPDLAAGRSSRSAPSPAASARRRGRRPAAWVTRQRVVRARRCSSESDASIEEIARLVRLRHRGGAPAPLRPDARHQPAGLPAHVRAQPGRLSHRRRRTAAPVGAAVLHQKGQRWKASRRARPAAPGASWRTRRPARPTPARDDAERPVQQLRQVHGQERPRTLVGRLILHPDKLRVRVRRERRLELRRPAAGRAARCGRSRCRVVAATCTRRRAGRSRPCPSRAAPGSPAGLRGGEVVADHGRNVPGGEVRDRRHAPLCGAAATSG